MDKTLVTEIVEKYLEDSDRYLVDVKIEPEGRIVVEIDGDQPVTIKDCIALTRHIETKIDREVEDFELEVGSAGISQPFKTLRQYRKALGKEVEILLKNGKKHTGVLKEATENGLLLTVEKAVKPEGAKRKITIEEDCSWAYNEIKYTKYIIRFK